MRAITLNGFGGIEVMQYTEAADPQISAGQILIRVVASSVNRPDIVQRQGNYPPPKGDSDILGLDVAGYVEAVADDVKQWQIGDRVMALVGGGGYAELAVAWANHVMQIPSQMSFEQAACVCETYLTAYLNLFELGGLSNDQSALIHGGGGGVNTAALHLVSVLTPDATTFVTASTGKCDGVKELGAGHVIDYRKEDFVERIAEITARRGVDVILDHIGADYLAGNMKSLALAGRLVIIGVMSGGKAELNLAMLMVKRQQILGSVLRSRPLQEKAELIARFTDRVLPFFANSSISPLIHTTMPMSDAAQAHQLMENSTHFGKIVLINEAVDNIA